MIYLHYIGNFHYILETAGGIPLTSSVVFATLKEAQEWAECWTTSFIQRPKVGLR